MMRSEQVPLVIEDTPAQFYYDIPGYEVQVKDLVLSWGFVLWTFVMSVFNWFGDETFQMTDQHKDDILYAYTIIVYATMAFGVSSWIYLRVHHCVAHYCRCFTLVFVCIVTPLTICVTRRGKEKYESEEHKAKVRYQKALIMRRVFVDFIVNLFSSILIGAKETSFLNGLLLTIYFAFETMTLLFDIYDIDGNFSRINLFGQCLDTWNDGRTMVNIQYKRKE